MKGFLWLWHPSISLFCWPCAEDNMLTYRRLEWVNAWISRPQRLWASPWATTVDLPPVTCYPCSCVNAVVAQKWAFQFYHHPAWDNLLSFTFTSPQCSPLSASWSFFAPRCCLINDQPHLTVISKHKQLNTASSWLTNVFSVCMAHFNTDTPWKEYLQNKKTVIIDWLWNKMSDIIALR